MKDKKDSPYLIFKKEKKKWLKCWKNSQKPSLNWAKT